MEVEAVEWVEEVVSTPPTASTPQLPQLPDHLNSSTQLTLTTSYTLWLAPLCLLLGILLAWLLYERGRRKDGFSRGTAIVLGTIRAIVVAIIAFFLLEPMIRMMVREIRRPVVVIAHDGSSSLIAKGDTNALRNTYAERLRTLSAQLSDRYEVREFTYGQEIRTGLQFGQQDALTDISQVFREIHDRFNGSDLGAVIIDGDGIYNRGRDPLLDAGRLGVPVHVIAMGDTTVYPDLLLRSVDHNRISYLGNEFPLLARIEARHLRNARSRVSIMQGGREVAGKDIAITADPYFVEVPFTLKADRPGRQHYTVSVRPIDNEATDANNTQQVYVEVLDDRQKILLLGAGPHPDLGAIRLALDGLDSYETEIAFASDFNGKVEGHDLIIMHQLPSVKHNMRAVIQRAAELDIPVCHVLGPGMDMNAFNAIGAGVRISGSRPMTTDAQGTVNKDLELFTMEPEQVRAIENFPPLQIPFGQYEMERGATALLRQRIGMVRTQYPLISILQQGERRMATIAGEGIWRWRLADMSMNGTHQNFDRLIHKMVQFLALKVDKNRFRVVHEPEYAETDPVIMTAELYNASYEPVNTAEVSIVLMDTEGREYPYAFSPVGNGYRLDAGRMRPGRYLWKATTSLQGEQMQASGEFNVKELMAERMTTVADHGLWADMAARTQGMMVTPDRMEELVPALTEKGDLVARSYTHASFNDLIGWRWLFFVILALLTAEWALRRRNGAY